MFPHSCPRIQRLGSKNVENILLRMKNNEEMLIPPDRSFLLNLLAKPGLSREEAVVQVLDLFSGGIDTVSLCTPLIST